MNITEFKIEGIKVKLSISSAKKRNNGRFIIYRVITNDKSISGERTTFFDTKDLQEIANKWFTELNKNNS